MTKFQFIKVFFFIKNQFNYYYYDYVPFTCCTDVSLRSQRSSKGCVAAGSKSAVYCLIPPDVL